MPTFKHLLIGLISVMFLCGTVVALNPTNSQADFFKKKSFPQAPFIKNWFQKTVCGFRNPGARFVTSKDGKEVCDRTSGNIFEQDLDSTNRGDMNHANAIEFCAMLDKGHGQVYELPSVQQLVSVLDYTERNPALTPGVFANVRSDFHWSATGVAGDAEFKWLVGVGGSNGWVIEGNRVNSRFVWCVRRGKGAH